MNQPVIKKNPLRRLGRIVLKTVLFIIVLFIVVVLLILTPPVQNFLRKKAVTYLENKLHTKVQVGRIYIGLPKKIVVEDVYLEDQRKDTLLSAGSVKVDMALLKLIFKQQLEINSVKLDNITAMVNRQDSDTNFNYQFIVDAFSPKPNPSPAAPADTTSSSISINSIILNKARLVYDDVVTGTKADTWIDHFDTKINKYDAEHLLIDIPYINVNGLVAHFHQVKPLTVPNALPDSNEVQTIPANPHITLGRVAITKSNLGYSNDIDALYTTADIGSLMVELKKIDFAEQEIDFDDVVLENTSSAFRMGQKEAAKKSYKGSR